MDDIAAILTQFLSAEAKLAYIELTNYAGQRSKGDLWFIDRDDVDMNYSSAKGRQKYKYRIQTFTN